MRFTGNPKPKETEVRYEYRFIALEGATRHHLTDRPHRRIIEEHAADGWRLVQVLRGADQKRHPNDMELIFERPVEAGAGGEAPAQPV
jgi:hypothetical protein